jgi:hypothetical protein
VAFNTLMEKLLEAPILTIQNILKSFILDVDWLVKGVGTFLYYIEGIFSFATKKYMIISLK